MTRPDARDRVVDAAVRSLRTRGISVGLEGISLEDAIKDSGVSRATAYRRWPNRAEFTREVLIRVVRAAQLEHEAQPEIEQLRTLLEHHRDSHGAATNRHTLIVEALRISTGADHQRLASSQEWRDYLALRLTCGGLTDPDLRTALTRELRATEQEFIRHRTRVYSHLPILTGYRFRIPLPDQEAFALLAETMGALMTGLVLDASTGVQSDPFSARAFGSETEAEWTPASYALTSALLAQMEPDPQADWNAERALALLDDIA
ncbi:MAG: TetR/AcrR family transcriptional regulator [Ancrocorticia sp.]|uniref:TetR/AcrR family transcriptional regulator n=1 Tax=Ancrocorticia sp. TaxID=2593684 RepID=UPI003F928CCE